jgi:hypothetical protein
LYASFRRQWYGVGRLTDARYRRESAYREQSRCKHYVAFMHWSDSPKKFHRVAKLIPEAARSHIRGAKYVAAASTIRRDANILAVRKVASTR